LVNPNFFVVFLVFYASICYGILLEVLSTKNCLQNAPPKNMPVITRVLWLRGYPKNEMRPGEYLHSPWP